MGSPAGAYLFPSMHDSSNYQAQFTDPKVGTQEVLQMRFRLGWLLLLLVSCVFLSTMPATAQTRTNTKELSKELQKVAEQKRKEAERLREKARAVRAEVDAAKKKKAENDRAIAELERELQERRKKKIEALRAIVKDIMDDPKIGHLARAKPQRVRMVPTIQQILEVNPWIAPALDDILKEYE